MYFVGIDWADEKHDLVVMDHDGNVCASFQVPHNSEGMQGLKRRLLKISEKSTDFACIIETRNGLMVQFLLENSFPVYPVNPKQVNSRRKPSGAKTDFLDALALANIGRADLPTLQCLQPLTELVEELRILTRDQDSLIQDSTRLKNRLIACLKEYYPVALKLFSKPYLPVALAFVKKYPNYAQARKASVKSLESFLIKHHYGQPHLKARELREMLQQPQLLARQATERAKSQLMQAIVAQIEAVEEQIRQYDEVIGELFQRHSDSTIFQSLPAAGKRLGPRLLAEWGDNRSQYHNYAAVQSLAGTCPVIKASGKYHHVKQRKSCVKAFRRVMHQYAFVTAAHVEWAGEYYARKRAEGKRHHEAVRALANVWVRIIYAIWQKKGVYDGDVFLEAQQKHRRAA